MKLKTITLITISLLGGSTLTMAPRLNIEEYKTLKKIMTPEMVDFVTGVETSDPSAFEKGLPEVLFPDASKKSLNWLIEQADAIQNNDSNDLKATIKELEDRPALLVAIFDTSLSFGIKNVYEAIIDEYLPINSYNKLKPLTKSPTEENKERFLLMKRLIPVVKKYKPIRIDQLNTPLSDAIDNLNIEAVKILLDLGSDPNIIGPSGKNSLNVLFDVPRYFPVTIEEIAKLLIEAGVNVNYKGTDDKRWPILMQAVNGAITVGTIKLLLDAGADPTIGVGNTLPFNLAQRLGRPEEILELLRPAETNG